LRGVSALVHAEGEFQRIQAVLFDITAAKQAELDRDRLELDLHLRQKLEAVGQLAAGLAHEINTPVQFIGNSVTFLKEAADELLALTNLYHELLHTDEPIDKEERQRRATIAEEASDLEYLTERLPPAFERALDGIDRVSSIVCAMRQFAHPSTQRAPIDVNEGLQTTLIVATSEYKYVADVELDLGELPLVMASGGELNQVFLNLIVNAAHAIESRVRDTDQRGKITVRTRVEEAGVVITVSDNGCGIPAEIAGRVFDPFFTTKEVGRGTGQGLAIAHSIVVERHHGAINFEPNPGGGTTFRVLLPPELNHPAADSETLDTDP
jgi:signal transduction histidine kinase